MPASTRPRLRPLLAVGLVAGAVASTLAAAPALAKPVDRGSFIDVESGTDEDFCDVEGLTIEFESTFSARYQFNVRKPGTAPYLHNNGTVENVYRNADGVEVFELVRLVEKDLQITDNGDGTLTVLVLATGNATVTGPDGRAIARNPGQVRYEVLVDYGADISDPSDDMFLEFLGQVKGSTGRSDDFCAAVVPVLS